MPKKPKYLTNVLYTYVKPTNDKYIRARAKKLGIPYSLYVDRLIEKDRKRHAA